MIVFLRRKNWKYKSNPDIDEYIKIELVTICIFQMNLRIYWVQF